MTGTVVAVVALAVVVWWLLRHEKRPSKPLPGFYATPDVFGGFAIHASRYVPPNTMLIIDPRVLERLSTPVPIDPKAIVKITLSPY